MFYIWYESDRFKVTVIPDAKGFDGSKEKHSLAGLCADAEKARIDGPLQVGHVFCGCKPCTQFDFSNCLMKREFGVLKAVECKRDTQISPTAPSQTQTLEEWAASLDAGSLVVLHAARDRGAPRRKFGV